VTPKPRRTAAPPPARRRIRIVLPAALLLAIAAALHVRVQPAGFVRVVRRGGSVSVLSSRIGFSPVYLGTSCLVPAEQGLPSFSGTLRAIGAAGDANEAEASLVYSPPASLPPSWPDGSWCDSLGAKLHESLQAWLRTSPSSARSGGGAAAALRASLVEAGATVTRAEVTLRAPGGTAPDKPSADIARSVRGGRPVLLVALDGADWQLLDKLVAEGAMPHLAALVREGQSGVLLTQYPPLSPLVWTSMMTGVSPIEHGILDFTRIHPATRTREPITSDERRVPAIWNMASVAGKKVAVFGMWATYPAETVDGLIVSDRYFSFGHQGGSPPPGFVYPPDREAWARDALARAEKEIDYEDLVHYLPSLDEAEYRTIVGNPDPYSRPSTALRRILIETRVYHDLALAYLSEKKTDLAVVYVEGTDAIGHVFAPYAPPREPEITAEDYKRYSGVPKLYFEYVDTLLGDYRDLAKKTGAVLMLASDHGFLWSEGRPKDVSSLAPATAARWHRDEGMYVLWGPGIPAGKGHEHKGSVGQVCSTLLALLGLPPGEGLQGPALPGAPAQTSPAVDYRAHFRRQTATAGPSPEEVAEDLAKLKAIGYIGSSETGTEAVAPGSTRTATSYNNEGLILRSQGRSAEAVAAYEQALAVDAHNASTLWNLSDALYVMKSDLDRSDALLVQSLADGSHAGVRRIVARATEYEQSGQGGRGRKLLDDALAIRPSEPELHQARVRFGP
jgi:tetratricopeptide (TPR) repeat protein